MQFRRLSGLTFAISISFWASQATAISLLPMEEPTVPLVSFSSPVIPTIQYSFASSPAVISFSTNAPLLCANTSQPTATSWAIQPTYYPKVSSPSPFVFGATDAQPTVSNTAIGASFTYGSTTASVLSVDPSLACYGLGPDFTHGPTRDVMLDGFEGVPYDAALRQAFNSTVEIVPLDTPNDVASTGWFTYRIDITIGALPSFFSTGGFPNYQPLCKTSTNPGGDVDCNFSLVEGYDTSVFDTTSGQWCVALAGATSCAFPVPSHPGNININYSNFATNGWPVLVAPVEPAAAADYHFVVARHLRSGVTSLPNSSTPIALAALFSPTDLEENKLDDNVSVVLSNGSVIP